MLRKIFAAITQLFLLLLLLLLVLRILPPLPLLQISRGGVVFYESVEEVFSPVNGEIHIVFIPITTDSLHDLSVYDILLDTIIPI